MKSIMGYGLGGIRVIVYIFYALRIIGIKLGLGFIWVSVDANSNVIVLWVIRLNS